MERSKRGGKRREKEMEGIGGGEEGNGNELGRRGNYTSHILLYFS